MKKTVRLAVALLVIALLATGITLVAAAETTGLPATCPQCNKAVTWTEISTVADDATSIAAGHYYMDYAEDTHNWTNEKAVSGAVCIYMNGKTLTATERVFSVTSGGTLSICGTGTVKGGNFASGAGTTSRYGGAVYVWTGGKLVLRDATLTDTPDATKLNNSSNGGVVCVYGTFDMYSGAVQDGKASNSGGNIFVAPAGVFNMYGGTVSGGTCSTGKSICAQGKVLLSGDAAVNHIYLWDKSVSFTEMLTIQGKYTGSVTLQFRGATYTEGLDLGVSDNADVKKASIVIENCEYNLLPKGTDLVLSTEAADSRYCEACGKNVSGWQTLDGSAAALTELTAGHYFLDFSEGSDPWKQKNITGDVCIDLNGQTLQGVSRLFYIPSGSTLSIQGEGNVSGGGFASGLTTADRAGGVIYGNGTTNIYGGTYTAAKYGDNTALPYNGGIISSSSGTVNIYGGTLSCPDVGGIGSSIFVGPSGDLNLYGGTVKGEAPAVAAQGNVLLAGDVQVSYLQLRYKSPGPAFGSQLTVKDAFSGSVQIQFYDSSVDAQLVEGASIGISDNANLRHGAVSVLNSAKAAVDMYIIPVDGKLTLSANAPEAETKEAHCSVCGKTVTWTALMEDFAGQTELKTGHYYLDFASGNAVWNTKTVTGRTCLDLNGQTLTGSTRAFVVDTGAIMNIMGEGTVVGRGKSSSLKLENRTGGTIEVANDAVLNLYGGKLTFESVDGQSAGNGGIMNVSGTFNMYGGEVANGKSTWVGGNIFVTVGGAINLYGGQITGGSASQAGNSIACRGRVTLAGDAKVNEIYLYPNTAEGGPALSEMLTIEGKYTGSAKLRISSANAKVGTDIGTNRQADLTNATITTTSSAAPSVVVRGSDLLLVGGSGKAMIFNGTEYVDNYADLAAAVAAYSDPAARIVLLADVSSVEVTKDVCVDLNGYDIGAVTGTGTLYCMDSATDDYDISDGVYGSVPASSQVQGLAQGNAVAEDGYVMLAGENNTVSFHRLTLKLESMSLRPSDAGLYMTCSFAGDTLIKEQIKGFGVALEVNGDPADEEGLTKTATYDKESFGAEAAHSLLVYGIMKKDLSATQNDDRAQMQVNGRAYVETENGKIYGNIAGRSLQDMMVGVYDGETLKQVGIDGMLDGLTSEQHMSLFGMYVEYKAVLEGWNIPNLKEVAPADQAALEKAIADEEILQERRALVTAKMRQMGDIYWRATEDITYHISSNARWVDFKAGRVYRGMPYAYARSDDQTFLEFALEQDEKGIYNIGGLTTDHMGNGSSLARIGNDCSGSVNFAWNQAGADISGTQSSRYMIEANGYLKVGDYEYTPTEDGRVGVSKEIVAANGQERMYAAYAKVQAGDALDTTTAAGGHVILVMGKHVVYNADGSIDPDRSYIHTLEQTPGPVSRGVERHSWNEELGEVVYDIYMEKKTSFASLFNSGYLPITCNVLNDASPVEAAKVTDSLPAAEYTYENLFNGLFTTNRMVSSATMTVTDANCEVFHVTGSGIRAKIKSYDLQNFLTENYEGHMVLRGELALDKLVAGNQYHCTVVVSLASGEQITVRDFDFTATDKDISTPNTPDDELPPEEEEGDAGIDEPTTSAT